MDIKYTKSGKKVAVLGKLNSESWIVQELFVSNGHEYPAGENFIEKTLLDSPAETWQATETKRIEIRKKEAERELETLHEKTKVLRRKVRVSELINSATEKYENLDIKQLDTFLNFISGKITHLVHEKWGTYEIANIFDTVEALDSWHGYKSLDGLKLVSLFGCRENGERNDGDRKFALDWRINEYRDGSGTYKKIYPCKSHQEAVELVDDLIKDEDANEELIKLKAKYSLSNPTQEKIAIYNQKRAEAKLKEIEEQEKKLNKLMKEHNEIKGGGK